MTKKEYIAYWLESAEKDLETMEYLAKGKKYVHALFFGHLYLEKISKALWINNSMENYAPKIHNILSLLKKAEINLDEQQQLFLLKLNQYNIEARYPEDIENIYRITDKTLTEEFISEIKSIAECLLNKLQ